MNAKNFGNGTGCYCLELVFFTILKRLKIPATWISCDPLFTFWTRNSISYIKPIPIDWRACVDAL